MSLEDKINSNLKTAMLNKEKIKLEALRAIKAAILLAKTDKSFSQNLTEADELKLLQRLVKQRKDSAEIYKSQKRDDLYQKEISEQKVIEQYLPKQLSNEELTEKVKSIIEQTGAESKKDMGKVMGVATKELTGKADGKTISEIVRSLLSS